MNLQLALSVLCVCALSVVGAAGQSLPPLPPSLPGGNLEPDRSSPLVEPGAQPGFVPTRGTVLRLQSDGSPVSVDGLVSTQLVLEQGLMGGAELELGWGEEGLALDEVSSDEIGAGDASVEVDGSDAYPYGLGFSFSRGNYKSDEVEGSVNSFSLPLKRQWSERVEFTVSLPIFYTEAKLREGSGSDFRIWSGGALLSMRYGVAIPEDRKNYRWYVTPTVGMVVSNVVGEPLGSWSGVLGLSSSFAYRLRPGWIVRVGNSVALYHSDRLGGSEQSLGSDTQGQLLNGVMLIHRRNRWSYQCFVIDNRFFNNAAVKSYQTYGARMQYQLGRTRSLGLTYYTDQGRGYAAHSVGVFSAWKF